MANEDEPERIVGVSPRGSTYLLEASNLGPEVFHLPREVWMTYCAGGTRKTYSKRSDAVYDQADDDKATAVRYVLADDQGGE